MKIIALILILAVLYGVIEWVTSAVASYWYVFAIIFGIFVFYRLLFWITHRRPLNENEIKELSECRRIVYINKIFQFTHDKAKVNPAYRSSLDKEGRWDRIDISLTETPALITELLRYKRHEWSVWCLTDEEKSRFIWANKGDDNESCYFKGSISHLVSLAKGANCSTVIHFHNHPHTAERTWNLLSPSKQDLKTLEKMSERFDDEGMNYISALCSQGNFIVYGSSFSTKYYPPGTSTAEIEKENGISQWKNYKLHRELQKNKGKKIAKIK